ncbi:MAG: hypothetical protein ACRDTJ_08390, partial [Pseudonocardiaceae bacterium]
SERSPTLGSWRPAGHQPHPEMGAPMPTPRVDATLQLSARTLNWLAQRPHAQLMADSVWDALAELERAGHHPRLLAALRFVLIHHQPTSTGRCRACRRVSWRGLWRRRRFPCVVWRQIGGELLGHLTISCVHRLRVHSSRSVR